MRRLVFTLFCCLPLAVAAEEENLLFTVAGRLLDHDNQPVEGTPSITVSVYPVAANVTGEPPVPPLWAATYTNVPVVDGLFSLVVGDESKGPALPARHFDDPARWLAYSVNDVELRPRHRISPVPHARLASKALVAGDALTLRGETPADLHDAAKLTGIVPKEALAHAVTGLDAAAPLELSADGTDLSLSLPQATATQDGFLTKEDWQRFNDAVAELASGAGGTGGLVRFGTVPQQGDITITGAVSAAGFSGSGAALTNLDARQLTTGTLDVDRLPPDVARLSGAQSFSGAKSFDETVTLSKGLVLGTDDAASCGPSSPALLRVRNGTFEICLDGAFRPVVVAPAADGSTPGKAAANCKAIKDAWPNTPDGEYWVHPAAPFKVWCDMTSDGGGWMLVANIANNNANHIASRSGVNLAPAPLYVPYENQPAGRKLPNPVVHQLASEGTVRVSVGLRSSPEYRAFFRFPAGFQNANFACSGSACPRIIVSHSYPYVWESSPCTGLLVGYHVLDNRYYVFDMHDDKECGDKQWSSSKYPTERVLYRYPADGEGIYSGRFGYTWVR